MARDFYPFVEEDKKDGEPAKQLVTHPARIAVYDDASAAPRVVIVEPKDVRAYLEEITGTVNKLSHEQGGTIPFMVIREIVENFIHAYFQAPTITILDSGNTIRFSDQGPGIREKDLALEYGTSSATEEMRQYIRGVGSGLPYVQQYMEDKGGSLTIDDNIQGGTVVTISIHPKEEAAGISHVATAESDAAPQGDQAAAAAGAYAPQAGIPQVNPYMPYGQQMAAGQPAAVPAQAQPVGYDQYGRPIQQPAAQPGTYPQQAGYPWPAGYQQQPGAFQQQPAWGQQAAYPQQYAPQVPAQQMQAPVPDPTTMPQLSERGAMVLDYLARHETCGPTDLVREYGLSGPTWTRELQSLAASGFVMKTGQKHHLTALGRSYV